MEDSLGPACTLSASSSESPPEGGPKLLPALEPWGRTFLRNLVDAILFRPLPRGGGSSPPGEFWPDVFVTRGLPWAGFLQSWLGHGLVLASLVILARAWALRPQPLPKPRFDRSQVIYFSPSEYLPPLDTGQAQAGKVADNNIRARAQKGQREDARQTILSVPPEADNHEQTIVTPADVKLQQNVPIPNLVAWSDPTIPVPIDVTKHDAPQLALPVRVVPPPPEVEGVSHVTAEGSYAAATQASLRESAAAVVLPPPAVEGAGSSSSGKRMIALSNYPVTVAPPAPPPGNRRGSFSASAEGKPGAAGAPDIAAEKVGGDPRGTASQSGSDRGGITRDAPPGLHVGAPPQVAASGTPSGSGSEDPVSTRVTASTGHAGPSLPRAVVDTSRDEDREPMLRQVFGERRIYAMMLNMPNLNSAGGSWVIRFSELHKDGREGDLSAPVPEQKVDPAYPIELMRQNVGGTVALRAVIRADGSVGEVRVLRSVDERLDRYAAEALSRWHFYPATKNGTPIDLEALFTIPFKPVRQRRGF